MLDLGASFKTTIYSPIQFCIQWHIGFNIELSNVKKVYLHNHNVTHPKLYKNDLTILVVTFSTNQHLVYLIQKLTNTLLMLQMFVND